MSTKTRQISHYTLVYDDDEGQFANLVGGKWEVEPTGQIAWLHDDERQGETVGNFTGTMLYTQAREIDLSIIEQAAKLLGAMRGEIFKELAKQAGTPE